MFSKRMSLVALALFAASCTPKLGEKPPAQEAYQYNGGACLSEAGKVASEYVKGEARDAAVEGAWDCFATAFQSFNRYVRGENRDSYTPQEIATFFEKNFLKDGGTRLGPGLQREFMRLKQVFVGGRGDVITRSEILGVIEVSKSLKTITVRLNRYMPIFLMKWKVPANPGDEELKYFESGNLEIQRAARGLAALVRKDHEPYRLSSFVELLEEVSKSFGENWPALDAMKRFLPVAQKVKKALAGGDEDLVRSDEWSRILVLGGRGYIQYLRYVYFIQPSPDGKTPLNYVALTVQDTLSAFSDMVREKPEGRVTRKEVDDILEAFSKAWPKFRYSEALVTEAMRVKQVLFGGGIDEFALADFQNAGLKLGHLRRLLNGLAPYETVYSGNWDPRSMPVEDAYSHIAAAEATLNTSVRELGGLFESSYDINSFRKLLHEMDALYPNLGPEGGLEKLVAGYLPTVIDLKNVVFADQGTMVKTQQWGPFLGLISRVYLTYRFYTTFIRDGGMIPESRSVSIQRLIDQVLGLVADTLSDKADHQLDEREATVVLKGIGTFWTAFKVSDGLIAEALKLKPALVGGSDKILTQGEFVKARSKFAQGVGLMNSLNAHRDVLFGTWNPNTLPKEEAERRFAAAESAVFAGLAGLAAAFEGPYDVARLPNLLREVELLYPTSLNLEALAKSYVPTLIDLKKVLFGDDTSVVGTSQWSTIFTVAGRAFVTYRFYSVFVLNSMSSEELVANLERIADRALVAVADTLRAKPGQALDRRELAVVLRGAGQFMSGLNIPPGLLAEIMKLKPVLAGGGTENITAAEVDHLRSKVPTLIRLWQNLDAYMYVYKGDWKGDGMSHEDAIAFHDLAWGELEKAAVTLTAMFEAPYDMENLTGLLREYEAANPPEAGESSLTKMLADAMPLLRQLKNVMFSDQDGVIAISQWNPLFRMIVKGFSAYRFFGVFIDARDGRQPEIVDSWNQLVDRGLNMVRDVLALKKNGLVSRNEILKIALQAQKAGYLPKDIRSQSLNSLVGMGVNRILNPPERRLGGEWPEGIRAVSVDYARREFHVWNETRAFLLETFEYSDDKRISPDSLRQAVASAWKKTSSPELKAGLGELAEILDTPVPFVLDSKGRLLISKSRPKYDLKTLESHNLWRGLVRLMVASYAGSMAQVRSYDGLGLSELQQAFRDVRPVAIDYNLLDDDNNSFMTSRFMELNIFMPHSNGDQVASFAEMHDEITSIVSGLRLNSLLAPNLHRSCMGGAEARRVSGLCLYRSYQSSFRTVMTSMPDFQAFQKGASDADFYAYFNNLLKGVGHVAVDGQDMVKISNANLIPPLMQYLELLYVRFDANRNGVIEVEEAKRAFPVFKGLLKIIAKKELDSGSIKEDDLLAVFVWVLKEGKPPETLFEKLRFLAWKASPEKWQIAADRSKLASILGYIGEQLAKAK